jgi:hypothetical protein
MAGFLPQWAALVDLASGDRKRRPRAGSRFAAAHDALQAGVDPHCSPNGSRPQRCDPIPFRSVSPDEILVKEKGVHTFLVNVAQGAAIWLVLVVMGVVVALMLAKRDVSASGRPRPRWLRQRRDRRSGTANDLECVEKVAAAVGRPRLRRLLRRGDRRTGAVDRPYAEEVAIAAGRAAVKARCCRQEWLIAQQRVEAAWQAFQATDSAAGRAAATTVSPISETSRTPSEYAARERYLHRAAMAAYWRADIGASTLVDALAHRNGWDPRLHPAEQEIALGRAARADRLLAHQRAAESERAAWREAVVAAADARRLRAEALAAAPRFLRWKVRRLPAVAPVIAPARAVVDAVGAGSVGSDRTRQAATRPIGGADRTVTGRQVPARWAAARAGKRRRAGIFLARLGVRALASAPWRPRLGVRALASAPWRRRTDGGRRRTRPGSGRRAPRPRRVGIDSAPRPGDRPPSRCRRPTPKTGWRPGRRAGSRRPPGGPHLQCRRSAGRGSWMTGGN